MDESRSFEKKLADATKTKSEEAAALEQKLADLNAKLEDAGTSGTEKELAQLKRELQLRCVREVPRSSGEHPTAERTRCSEDVALCAFQGGQARRGRSED